MYHGPDESDQGSHPRARRRPRRDPRPVSGAGNPFRPTCSRRRDSAARVRRPTTSIAPPSRSSRSTRPASTDLDQAFAIERSGGDLLLHYAIADVAWFVDDGGVIDAEAWRRGATLYLPDGKAGLYPPVLRRGRGEPAARTARGRRWCSPSGSPATDAPRSTAPSGRSSAAAPSSLMKRVTDADLPPDFAELARRDRGGRGTARRGAGRSARAGSRRTGRRPV